MTEPEPVPEKKKCTKLVKVLGSMTGGAITGGSVGALVGPVGIIVGACLGGISGFCVAILQK